MQDSVITGAGGDYHGIDHHQNSLGFAYVFISSRSHYLPPHSCLPAGAAAAASLSPVHARAPSPPPHIHPASLV
jgi:hypothetical protein